MTKNRSFSLLFILALILMACCFPAGASDGKVNINTATEKELCILKDVGPVYAAAIVKYRKEHGSFEVPEDIIRVKGVGLKTFEKNKDIIVVKDEKS